MKSVIIILIIALIVFNISFIEVKKVRDTYIINCERKNENFILLGNNSFGIKIFNIFIPISKSSLNCSKMHEKDIAVSNGILINNQDNRLFYEVKCGNKTFSNYINPGEEQNISCKEGMLIFVDELNRKHVVKFD